VMPAVTTTKAATTSVAPLAALSATLPKTSSPRTSRSPLAGTTPRVSVSAAFPTWPGWGRCCARCVEVPLSSHSDGSLLASSGRRTRQRRPLAINWHRWPTANRAPDSTRTRAPTTRKPTRRRTPRLRQGPPTHRPPRHPRKPMLRPQTPPMSCGGPCCLTGSAPGASPIFGERVYPGRGHAPLLHDVPHPDARNEVTHVR
jgi:hypothetical protein